MMRLLPVLLLIFPPNIALAAEFHVLDQMWKYGASYEDPVCNIRLTGQIENSDLAKFQQVLRQVDPRYDGAWTGGVLCLNSPGGSYQEGLRIAGFLLKQMISTVVEPNAICFSACSIIFLAGGTFQEETHVQNRWLHVDGQLGFHAPFLKGISESAYGAQSIEEAYRAGVRAIRDLARLGNELRVNINQAISNCTFRRHI